MPLLEVQNLQVSFNTVDGPVDAVRGLDFQLEEGEILGLVGETGSGKSVSCKAITRLLPDNAVIGGKVMFRGEDLLSLPLRSLRHERGLSVSMIFQDPQSCLNPIRNIGSHLREVLLRHGRQRGFKEASKERLKSLHIKSPGKRLKDYPFQFSGGMAQRVQIAMATTGSPAVMIADEPTTALDVTIQARILAELKSLARKEKLAVIFITHDLSVVAEICSRVAVMYRGRLVESGLVNDVMANPGHPYTRALLNSVPSLGAFGERLKPIVGDPNDDKDPNSGCSFAPRCSFRRRDCEDKMPILREVDNRRIRCLYPLEGDVDAMSGKGEKKPGNKSAAKHKTRGDVKQTILFEARRLVCRFPLKGSEKQWLNAVDRVDLTIRQGEILGVVGESGSGKSTFAKAVTGLVKPSSGELSYRGEHYSRPEWNVKEHARRCQYVFQDPLGALDPRMSILDQCAEALIIHKEKSTESIRELKAGAREKARQMLLRCGLEEEFHKRKPYNLSGGQRQRGLLARALVLEPEFLICDEPVSAMDVSVQAQILNLLTDLAEEDGLSILFISHDLSVVSVMCHRIAVMFAGQIVEMGPMKQLFEEPSHPYTRLLIDSIPGYQKPVVAEGLLKKKDARKEELLHDGRGCPYSVRCPESAKICQEERPNPRNIGKDHMVMCHAR